MPLYDRILSVYQSNFWYKNNQWKMKKLTNATNKHAC